MILQAMGKVMLPYWPQYKPMTPNDIPESWVHNCAGISKGLI